MLSIMSLFVQFFITSCCLVVGTAVIAIYCPPYCVCHETVWRCSSRSVTDWPLDNRPHIIMRGVTTLDMSKSNIEVLPNWPPTHNFPDLAMIFLADTVFDGERCHELECLQKLNLFILSSCPTNLRKGCSRAPCCFWSTPTTRRPFFTTVIEANLSTAFPTLQESHTRPMDATNADFREQANENHPPLKENVFSEHSTPRYDINMDRQGDERLFTVTESQAFEVTTEFSPRSPSTSVETEVSISMPEYFSTTVQDAVAAGHDERQLYLTSHHLTEYTTGQPASSRYDERIRHQQATLHQPASVVEYVEISERMVKPPTTKPTTPPTLPTSITRTGWTAAVVQLSTSTTRLHVASTRKTTLPLPEVTTSTERSWLTSPLPGSPEPAKGTDTDRSTIGRSSLENSGVTTTASPSQTDPIKENLTSTTSKKQSTRPTEGRYHDRLTSPSQTALRSTITATDQTTTQSPSLISERVSHLLAVPSTTDATTQTEIKSMEAAITLGTTEMSAYWLSKKYADSISSTEGLITLLMNTTGLPERVNVSDLLVDQEATGVFSKTEVTTSIVLAVKITSTTGASSDLSPAVEKQSEDANNSTDECTCPMCPSCFAEFAGYHLSKEQIAGIGASMAFLFLAFIVLLLKQCPATARYMDRFTPSCAARARRGKAYRPSFFDPGHPNHHFQGRPKQLSEDPWGNGCRTGPDPTVRVGDDGRFNNEYDQPEIRRPPQSRIPYAQEQLEFPVPRERKRQASVEIVNEQHIPPNQLNDGNAAGSFVEIDIGSDEGSVVTALDGSPVQLSADDAARMDTDGDNHLGFIAPHDDRQGDIELAAAASAGLLNPPHGQPAPSAGLSENVGDAGSLSGDDVVHEEDLSNGQEQQNEEHETNGAPPPPIQASPGRLASFLGSLHPILFGGGEKSTNNAAPPGRPRKRPATAPSSAERATTRSVSRGLPSANALQNANVFLDIVDED